MQKAIYAGSFDPFTNGHLSILKQASSIFTEVHIVIASNCKKQRMFSEDIMLNLIQEMVIREKLSNCKVIILNGLLARYSEQNDIHYLIRGLRNNIDYNYEENIALINNELNPNLNSIFLRANKPFVSSSFVKELLQYNEDISKYVPLEVENYIKSTYNVKKKGENKLS